MIGPVHYRITDHWNEDGSVQIDVEKFHVVRETPQGYWVLSQYRQNYLGVFPEWANEHRRWVPKSGSRYCQSTMADALESYGYRKRAQRKHLRAQLDKCERVLESWSGFDLAQLIEGGGQNIGHPGSQALFKLTSFQ